MKIGVVGKPSSGKSTFFAAATMVDVPIAAYPFTTIKPNIGVSSVLMTCPHKEFNLQKCDGLSPTQPCNGIRAAPITLIDVAGLVPDAHLGKGMGNQFLSDLMEAEGLIHVVDLSGKTDSNGNATIDHDPSKDIKFLEKEIDYWIQGILEKNWKNIQRKAKQVELYEAVHEQLSGLGIEENKVKQIIKAGYDDLLDLATKIRVVNKPLMIAGNKIDLQESKNNYDSLKDKLVPVSAESELALRKANKAGIISYVPGDKKFDFVKTPTQEQETALSRIQEKVLDPYGSTGVQKIMDEMIFKKLNYIAAFPVEDEAKFTDSNGRVLPDVKLLKQGSNALDLAFKVHTSIGEGFIGAIDCRKKRKVGKNYVLKNLDVIKILKR